MRINRGKPCLFTPVSLISRLGSLRDRLFVIHMPEFTDLILLKVRRPNESSRGRHLLPATHSLIQAEANRLSAAKPWRLMTRKYGRFESKH